ncbi:MAG: glycerate kinase [Melioribacteraceae bacterium]
MKILIAPDKFKDSLTAKQVCDAIEEGLLNHSYKIKVTKIPLADGGEGSLAALENTIRFEKIYLKVQNPLFKPIKTFYGIYNNSAFIELALASGLQLLNKQERNPMFTSSFGTGEIIKDAISKGVKKIFLFVGGSATNDCGIGIASALGYKFLDKQNYKLEPIGENLSKINYIKKNFVDPIADIEFNVLTDVNNKLYGKNGAAFVYAKQKGANDLEIFELDRGLKNFSKIVKRDFGIDISKIKGGGAAGGIGSGLYALFNAKIISGTEVIFDLLNIDEKIINSDFVITGEGLLDKQTLKGKVVKGIIDSCKKFNKPIGIICGHSKLSQSEIKKLNLKFVKTIKTNEISKKESMENAYSYLIKRSEELIKDIIEKK